MINPENLALEALPWLPLEEKGAFPRQPAIYFAIDQKGVVQYIGRSVDPKQRWADHHQYNPLSEIGSIRIAYLFIDVDFLNATEKALIRWFNPPLNTVGKEAFRVKIVSKKPNRYRKKKERLAVRVVNS